MPIIEHLTLNKDLKPILADRIRMRLPEEAWRDQRREGGLMGVAVSDLMEERIGIDVGPQRLIGLAEEKMLLVGGSMEAVAERYLEQVQRAYSVPWHGISTMPHPGAQLLVADDVAQGRTAIPMHILLFPHSDGTLIEVSFYINPGAVPCRGEWMAIGNAMAESAVPGERSLELGARTVHLDSTESPAQLQMDLLEGLYLSTDVGADFIVHRFDQNSAIGAGSGSVGVYLGHHPAYHYFRASPQPRIDKIPAELLGVQMEWHAFPVDEDVIKMEAIVPVPDTGPQPMAAHVFITGMDAADCKRLLAMVGTLR